jgi:hypothetical protein
VTRAGLREYAAVQRERYLSARRADGYSGDRGAMYDNRGPDGDQAWGSSV